MEEQRDGGDHGQSCRTGGQGRAGPASHSPQTKCGHHRLLYLQFARVPVQFLIELLLHYRKFRWTDYLACKAGNVYSLVFEDTQFADTSTEGQLTGGSGNRKP